MNNLEKILDILENRITGINNNFHNINSGGCGVMAKILADQLDNFDIEYEVACIMRWSDKQYTYDEVNSLIDDRAGYNMCNNHIVIKLEGRLWDCDGEYKLRGRHVVALVDNRTITRMVAHEDCWCSCFDRSQAHGMRVFTQDLFRRMMVVEVA